MPAAPLGRSDYPVTDRDNTVEMLHGRSVADPYRYLEDPDSPRTVAFVQAQNSLSRPYLDGLPGRVEFAAQVTALLTAPRTGVPWERGGRYFRTANPGSLDQDQLMVGDSLAELLAGGRLLLDPNTWSTDGTSALTGLSVSDDGLLAGYARSDAGSDWRSIGVLDVATGAELPDRLQGAKWLDPTWLPDDRSFLYWCYPDPPTTESGAFTEAAGVGQLALHRVGTDQRQDEVVWCRPEAKEWMVDPWVSSDGRLLVLTASPGTDSRTTITVRRLTIGEDGESVVRPGETTVVGELADAHHVVGSHLDRLYLRTDRDAPGGRLVAVDLTRPDTAWRTLAGGDVGNGAVGHDDEAQGDVPQGDMAGSEVPEGDGRPILADVFAALDSFLLIWSVDTAQHLQVRDRRGKVVAAPDFGRLVSFAGVRSRASSAEIFVGTTSFDHRLHVYRMNTRGTVTPLPGPVDAVALPPISAERRRGISSDGTAVPMSIVRLAELPEGPRPTLLYGYGGFDIPVLPGFSALFAGWIAAGGVLAVANLRGGGEFGTAWHEAGMGAAKQRVFDDLFGCAEALIASGVTTAEQLAVHGRSNGGLLVGAAITQRPELFAAALPTVGVLDMLRFHLFTIGWAWISEYGSAADPADFEVLLRYSPLHVLREGGVYPPTLISTGDHDDRVVPAHSLKFGAQLQHCQAGPGPVLLRIDTRAGHGMGKPVGALAQEYADQLAFAAAFTGLRSG